MFRPPHQVCVVRRRRVPAVEGVDIVGVAALHDLPPDLQRRGEFSVGFGEVPRQDAEGLDLLGAGHRLVGAVDGVLDRRAQLSVVPQLSDLRAG